MRAHRRERRLACLPEQLALGLVARDPHVVGAAALAHGDDLLEPRLAFALGPVELDQQRGAATRRVPRVGHLLARLDRDPVHHLDRARDHAGLHDLRHRLARRVRGVEERHERLDRLGRGHHAQPHLGGDPERALRADERAEQVVARGIELRTAQRDQLAVGQDDLQPAHVVRREPVLEAVRAAGVLGHVAADGAHDLRAGIGRVEEVGRHRGRDRRVRHAGLDAYALVGEVDLEHALQPRG
jgi:hypothetical protein